MSVIFFEGFNRTVDPNFWTLTSSSNTSRLPVLYGAGRTGNSSYRVRTADNLVSATQSTMTAKFSPASSTKVYLGYAIDYLATQQYAYGGGAVSGAKTKHLTVYDAIDAELFHVGVRVSSGALVLSLYSSGYAGGATPIDSFIINSTTNTPATSVTLDSNGGRMEGNWNYLEFEIDLFSNTVAARRNGQALYTQNTGVLTVLMPESMPSIGAFRFHGHPSGEYGIDDMYVATSAGNTANTWLGPDTRVYSPAFTAVSTPAEWSNGSSATPINSDDNDSGFISTNVINKVNVFDTSVSPSPSDAVVGCVKLLSVARKVTLDAAYCHVYKHTDDVIYTLSPNFDLTSTAYKRSSAFAVENPATSSPWTLAELDNGKFGVKSVAYVLNAALIPTFDATTATADGFFVQITNYDAAYTWAGTATASGSVVISSIGLVTVTGVAANTSSTATITTTGADAASAGSATVTKTSLNTALTPTFGTITSTATGFTVSITNYDAAYTWAGTSSESGGSVAFTDTGSGTGLATITGVTAGTSSTATITTTKAGYATGSATTSAVTSLNTALTPTFGSTTATAGGFTVQISNYNYNVNYTWAGTATASGTVSVNGTGLVTVTGVAADTSSTATITVTRTGYVTGTATVTKTSLAAALTPTFGSTTETADGFTVPITNYNATYTWAGTATAAGSVAISAGGLATITGVAANTSSTATITTTKANTVGGSATVTATSSLAAALTPTFGTPSPTATGFTVSITNYNSAYTWAGTATASGSVAINGSGLVTVTGVAANTSSTATITTTKSNTVGGSATVTATASLAAALTPTFASATATADGFTAQITNYNALYTWAGTATASGSVVVSGTGLVTVTGVAAATSSTATITTTKSNTVGGSAPTTATSLLAALTPAFGSTTSTSTGFTVQIANYNSSYTWAGTATASGTVAINGTGLVTVTGVAAATSSTATITTTLAGYAGGSATVTATSLLAALTPTFGTPTPTSTGFTAQINNYNIDSNNTLYTWAGTATASGSVSVSGAGLVTVTGVAASTSSTATITTTRAGYTGGSATVTATSTAASISITPNLASPQARSGSMMMSQVTVIFTAANIPSGYSTSWSITGSYPPSISSSSDTTTSPSNGTFTATKSITFMANGGPFDVTCTATNMMGGGSLSASYTGYTIADFSPTFGTPTPTSTGFTAQITNYDAAYTWGSSVTSGSVAISGTGLVTVTGVAANTSSTATITTTRTGYVSGTATVTATSLAPTAPVTFANVYPSNANYSVVNTTATTVTATLTGTTDGRLWLLINVTGTLSYSVTASSEYGYDGGRLYRSASAPAVHISSGIDYTADYAALTNLSGNVSAGVSGQLNSYGTTAVTAGQWLVLRYSKDAADSDYSDNVTATLSIS